MAVGSKIVWTFLIGLIAGMAPFLFMQLLPALLMPTQQLVVANYLAILLTGLLVGAITAIVFTKTFETRDPQAVFFYALGVPAVLIATVSNLSTISEAKHRATLARVEASNAILNVAPPPVEPMPLRQLTPSAPPGPSGHLLGPLAWAKAPEDRESLRLAGEDQYLVVIGTYTSEAAAWRALETLRRQRLNTELYIPKHLQVFQAGTNTYYVSYTAPLSREDAVKLYRLIQVNDPRLSPQILQQTNG